MASQLQQEPPPKESVLTGWLHRICGHSSEFDLEFQALNWILLMNAFMSGLLTVENLILQIPPPAAEATLGIALISLSGYYFVRIKKLFSRIIAPALYAFSLTATTLIWFSSDGIEGAMPYYYVVVILASISIMHGKTRVIVTTVSIFNLLALIGVELLFPQLVAPYPSEFARQLDILFTIIFAVIYGLGYISILMYNLGQRRELADRLLLNVLPAPIAQRLKYSPNEIIADSYECISVLFTDVVGFTPMSAQMSPAELVNLLNQVFTEFDRLAEKYGLEKIKTIGDCYMVCAGAPIPRSDHAQVLARFALEIRDHVSHADFNGQRLNFRVGIHSGPAVGGVIGQKKFAYDLWGDTVNTASRMETHGKANVIQVTESTCRLIKDDFVCLPRGKIQVKGKGEMDIWYVDSERITSGLPK